MDFVPKMMPNQPYCAVVTDSASFLAYFYPLQVAVIAALLPCLRRGEVGDVSCSECIFHELYCLGRCVSEVVGRQAEILTLFW